MRSSLEEILWGQGGTRRGQVRLGRDPAWRRETRVKRWRKGSWGGEGGGLESKQSRIHRARPISEKALLQAGCSQVSRKVHHLILIQYLLAEPLGWPRRRSRSLEIREQI